MNGYMGYITRKGFETLSKELDNLVHIERIKAAKMIEEFRPASGLSDDNPEFDGAIENQDRIEQRIIKINDILNNSTIFSKELFNHNPVVGFGKTILFQDLETNENKIYTIVSSVESDVQNGLISVEAPFIRNILGLSIGEEFEFNNKDYVLLNVDYSVLTNLI